MSWLQNLRTLTIKTIKRIFIVMKNVTGFIRDREHRALNADSPKEESNQMSRFRRLDLSRYQLRANDQVVFVSIDVSRERSPFALVHYALNGEEQPRGLRFDLDKRVLLDQPPGSMPSDGARDIGERITKHVGEILRNHP